MTDLLDLARLPGFLLIFARVTSFFVMLPIFSYRNIPTRHKIALGLFLAWIMFYTVDIPILVIDGNYLLLLLKEILVGLFIGFIAYLILSAVQIAGGFIDFQMGFAIANVIDPQTGAQSPLIGQYYYTIVILFLISVDAHHLLLDGVFYSYQYIALDQFIPFEQSSIPAFLIKTFNHMFVVAFQMAVPIVGTLFLVDVALGIIARTVPQLNVFVVGLPLKILVSFIVILLFMGIYFTAIRNLFETLLIAMRDLMNIIGGA
ncbi:flagellar biosynthetic protein FliR [Melghiribacillus thermohalophilus]|uniref:Flagellar biosynthetic protein FliR n=1 Tax=Melghiribacillus thermohalophilus TaxID=1324956 RepID=A0A4R3NAY5_9BACI|nr:flagellar biosynthetic protein FliR [Melghiribacillus thermohalophilus]TCT26757.1 flagellar biosynthetic protein FliR [Melghiribacillus thermohalophilus]